jgi:hypothetical protein
MKEFESDMTLNETNIHDKTLLRASLAAKWCRYEYEERRFKDKIQAAIDALKNQVATDLFEKKKQAIANKLATETMIKIETEKLVKNDAKYYDLKKAMEDQDDILRFIAEAKQIISQFGYDIKNAIDVLKLENG